MPSGSEEAFEGSSKTSHNGAPVTDRFFADEDTSHLGQVEIPDIPMDLQHDGTDETPEACAAAGANSIFLMELMVEHDQR